MIAILFELQGEPMSQPLPYADTDAFVAVTVLATALDELGARIYRDLHIESGCIDVSGSPQLAATLTDFSAYAEECLAALDNPAVAKALAAVSRRP